jgi:hypothetical protein
LLFKYSTFIHAVQVQHQLAFLPFFDFFPLRSAGIWQVYVAP